MEIVIVIGALVISFLVFTLLIRVVRATLRTAIIVALVLLALQLLFGIGPAAIWEQIQNWISGFESTSITR